MRDFVAEYVPSVLLSFLLYFLHSPRFFGSSIIATIIKSVVDYDANDVNSVAPILALKCIQ